eukprot:CAMPEP_0119088268 /NCGR_PEP_ID=MMETSP1178-20130426/144829_1 /TAXON_ID=33656 /ORGANISM="unid sp, Strain CCMP2000" /LENGTH=199 /DNA_ID=CAMNT_0007071541 /DNA_START=42 /DNA_END=641 /DNA_ORIENTATION=-
MPDHVAVGPHGMNPLSRDLPRWRDTCEAHGIRLHVAQEEPKRQKLRRPCRHTRRPQGGPHQFQTPVRSDTATVTGRLDEPIHGTSAALVKDPWHAGVLTSVCSPGAHRAPARSAMSSVGQIDTLITMSYKPLWTAPIDIVDPPDKQHEIKRFFCELDLADADEDDEELMHLCLHGHPGRLDENVELRWALADGRFILPC